MEEELACAKLNLALDVLGRREDGYHDLCMVMETVSLADTLRFSREGTGLRVRTNLNFLPGDQTNLAAVAARRFREATGREVEPLYIEIEKHIPVCAGMAGGSSDAAAVLRYLNRITGAGLSTQALAQIGEQVGSDVPYCVGGGTALAQGRGERLTPLPRLPGCWFVLCKPGFSISTPALFQEIDRHRIRRRPDTEGLLQALAEQDLAAAARRLYNVFEDVLPPRQRRQVQELKNALINLGAMGTAMSGTGPTVFGIFRDRETAQRAFQALQAGVQDIFLAHNV